jgi:hypothetical protein
MDQGLGEAWIVKCTLTLRELLPIAKGFIISHAPQAPYFTPKHYPSGGYLQIHRQVSEFKFFKIKKS